MSPETPVPYLVQEPVAKKPIPLQERVQAILALGRALHSVGQPSYRIENMLVEVGQRLGLPVNVFSLPTGLIVSVEDEGGPHTHILRVRVEGAHLERLSQLTTITEKLIHWEISCQEAAAEFSAVMKQRPRWGRISTIAAYVFSAAAFSVFFRGGSSELLVANVVGLAVGSLAVLLHRVRATSRLFELLAAAAAGLISTFAVSVVGPFEEWIPLASGLIILLPGISLVDAVDELANGHLAAGGARMAGVGVAFLAIAFGAVVGTQTAEAIAGHPRQIESQVLHPGAIVLALLSVAVGSTIRFRARPRHFLAILVGSVVAFAGSRTGIAYFGPKAGPFLAALLLGIVANAFSRIWHRPPELVSLAGIAVLVPGSVGVKGLGALISQEAEKGVAFAFEMFLIAMALTAGFLISNWIVPDRTPFASDP
jgi:uncharacterized membrane protein YjjP (DUF1212 family)